jgi:hypothetical protein
MAALVPLAIAYWLGCAFLVGCLYSADPVQRFRWNASLEIALAATVIAFLAWIKPIVHPGPRRGIYVAAVVAIQTGGLLGCYAALIDWLGPDSPVVTVFGFSASRIFREDALPLFAFLCVPVMACASGALCATTRWIVSRMTTPVV